MSAPDDQPRSSTRQVLPLVAARTGAALVSVLVPLYLARKLSLDDYGTYKQAFLLCAPLLSVLPLGMVQSLYYFVPREERPRPVLLQTLAFNAAMGFVAAVLTFFAVPLAARLFPNPALMELRAPLMAFVFLSLCAGTLESSLTSRGKTNVSALTYVVTELFKSAALVLPLLLGLPLRTIFAALSAMLVVRWAVSSYVSFRAPGGAPTATGLRRQLAWALPFGAAMALNVPQQLAHQYAVALVVSPAVFAIYAVGCFQVPFVDLLYAPTSEVLMVRVGELDRQGRGQQAAGLFREATRKLAFVFLPAAAFLFAAAPWIIRALFGDKFGDAVPIFRVSVLGVALASMPLDGLLRARGETKAIFLSYLLKAAVTVPLLLVAIPLFGLLGAISSWLLAEILGKALLMRRVHQLLGRDEWLPWKELAALAVATILCAGAVVVAAPVIDGLLAFSAERTGAVMHVGLALLLFIGVLSLAMRLTGLRPLVVLSSLRR